eukprot:Gb_39759 [translate_table: standard]
MEREWSLHLVLGAQIMFGKPWQRAVLLASGSLTNVRVEVGAEDPVLEDEVII